MITALKQERPQPARRCGGASQISVGSQAGLHCGTHCPAWQANPGEQIGAQLASGAWTTGAAVGTAVEVTALELTGRTSLRWATVAEMNIPAPSG